MSDALRVWRGRGYCTMRAFVEIMLRVLAVAIARLAGTVSMNPTRETHSSAPRVTNNGVASEPPEPKLRALSFDAHASSRTMPAGGRVKLDGPAPYPGVDVVLTANPEGVARLPRMVCVHEGDDQAKFVVDWQPQDRMTTVEITASAHGVDLTSVVVVPPPPFGERWWPVVVSRWHDVIASLLITAPLAPIIAAVISVGLMAAVPSHGAAPMVPVMSGFVVLGLAWLGFAFLLWALGITSPDRASLGTYGELNAQLPELSAWAEWAKRQLGPPSPATSLEAWRVARDEVERQLQEIQHERDKSGARWVLGSGYISLWQRLHRAQEALIDLQPLDAVIKHAQRDVLRIHNSTIANSDTYISLLQKSIDVIAEGRHRALASLDQVLQQVNDLSRALGTATTPGTDSAPALEVRSHTLALALDALPAWDPKKLATDLDAAKGAFASPGAALDDLRQELEHASTFLSALAGNAGESSDNGLKVITLSPPRTVGEAVSLVRTIRRALNEFRDGSRAGLVRERNQLLLTLGVTSIVMYTLLWLSLIVPADRPQIEAGVGYYLVGAVVGLFTRLRNEANAESGIDDFGLSLARLVAAPLLAGLAGVLGVVLISTTSATQNNLQASALVDAFNITKSPLNVVTAAIFGLSPGLLIDRLSQKSEQYKQDLKSSESSTATRPA